MHKFLQEFSVTFFISVAMKLLLNTNDLWSGQTTDQSSVLA